MQVMLIRHSKTAGNAQRRYIGRTDEPLSAEGIALAETVGQDLTLQKVYVTPLIATLYKSIQKKGLPNLTNNAALENKAAFYYAATSGQRGQRQYASYVPRRETGSAGCIPRRRTTHGTAGAACQGQSRRCAAVLRTLDRLSRLCYLPRCDGGYILQCRPLSLDRERAGG